MTVQEKIVLNVYEALEQFYAYMIYKAM